MRSVFITALALIPTLASAGTASFFAVTGVTGGAPAAPAAKLSTGAPRATTPVSQVANVGTIDDTTGAVISMSQVGQYNEPGIGCSAAFDSASGTYYKATSTSLLAMDVATGNSTETTLTDVRAFPFLAIDSATGFLYSVVPPAYNQVRRISCIASLSSLPRHVCVSLRYRASSPSLAFLICADRAGPIDGTCPRHSFST
jgi:hypothetical protein